MANLTTKTNCTLSDLVSLPLLCLPTPTHSFSSWVFQRMMRQVWWIVCWKPYSQELHSETAGRERQDPEVSLILYLCLYTTKDTHRKLVPIMFGKTVVLISVRCSKITMNPCPNLPTGCIFFLFCFLKLSEFNSSSSSHALAPYTLIFSHLQNTLVCCLHTCLLAPQCQRILSLTTLLQLFDVWIPVKGNTHPFFLAALNSNQRLAKLKEQTLVVHPRWDLYTFLNWFPILL